ncbi:MAG: hypothetical protein J2P23_07645 [Microlunatus sp.]|nr:hypothetical protein [Microlunatus sp.]
MRAPRLDVLPEVGWFVQRHEVDVVEWHGAIRAVDPTNTDAESIEVGWADLKAACDLMILSFIDWEPSVEDHDIRDIVLRDLALINSAVAMFAVVLGREAAEEWQKYGFYEVGENVYLSASEPFRNARPDDR